MEELLPITNINDFLFCPRSLYYGNIFRRSLGEDGFQQVPQKLGLAAHKTVDEASYSTYKDVLTGLMIHSETLGLIGHIDIFNVRTGTLTERKWSVSAVWEGYRMQLYAQARALEEKGYSVSAMRLHSKKDNRTYAIPLPTATEWQRLEEILDQMRSFRLDAPFQANPTKCSGCIYRELCDIYEGTEESV